MIRLSVFYPTPEGATVDHDCYRDKHVRLAAKTWGVEDAEFDKGVDGPSVAALQVCFTRGPGGAMGTPGMADNYTSITPLLQTSEIVG